MNARKRRIRDVLIAAMIAVLVATLGTVIYLKSDIRATTSEVASTNLTLPALSHAPTALQQLWELSTDARTGAVITPGGVVVTTSSTGVTGYRADTAEQVWSYQRQNVSLCAAGTQELPGAAQADQAGMKGVIAVFAKNSYCSQVVDLTSATGDPYYERTSPGALAGRLIFGGPYAAWYDQKLLELWRFDLYRTVQYGQQPSSPEPNSALTGCDFTDVAVAEKQFATLQRCTKSDSGDKLRLVLRWTDPDAEGKKLGKSWSTYKSESRLEVDTGSKAARLVGLTGERAAILVSEPHPALVVYDAEDGEISRTPVNIPAADIAAEPEDSLATGTMRLTQVGTSLVATDVRKIDTPVSTSTDTAGGRSLNPFGSSTPTSAQTTPPPAPRNITEPYLAWTRNDALGLPGATGSEFYLPVADGIAVISRTDGTTAKVLPVDRGSYTGAVRVGISGPSIVEIRGDRVIGLGAKE